MRVLRATVDSGSAYEATGGGQALARARALGGDRTIEEIERSGLRGRGGGGFPTGRKWRSVRDAGGTHRYVVANGAEGEPGTFKDRAILRANPYQVLEGVGVAAYAIGAREAFVACKASFRSELDALQRAAQEMVDAGMLGDVTVTLVAGPDEYLFGEETGLLEVIEGNEPLPRVVRPYEHGLFATSPQLGWQSHAGEPGHAHAHNANPTLVNNVETLANVTWVLTHGADEFRSVGPATSPGTLVFTVSGDVRSPAVRELPLGTPLGQVLDEVGGGVPDGRSVKMVLSGVANPVMTQAHLSTAADFDSLAAAGGGLGSGGFVVYDDTMCAVAVAREYSRFLSVESCGQCPPCKLQSARITAALGALVDGDDPTAQLPVLRRSLDTVTDGNRCYLAIEEQQVVASLLEAFPDDVRAHETGTCALRHDVLVPKIVDLTDAGVVLDERHRNKRPDWTYSEDEAPRVRL